jgi:hypothetical protein
MEAGVLRGKDTKEEVRMNDMTTDGRRTTSTKGVRNGQVIRYTLPCTFCGGVAVATAYVIAEIERRTIKVLVLEMTHYVGTIVRGLASTHNNSVAQHALLVGRETAENDLGPEIPACEVTMYLVGGPDKLASRGLGAFAEIQGRVEVLAPAEALPIMVQHGLLGLEFEFTTTWLPTFYMDDGLAALLLGGLLRRSTHGRRPGGYARGNGAATAAILPADV